MVHIESEEKFIPGQYGPLLIQLQLLYGAYSSFWAWLQLLYGPHGPSFLE